MSKKIFYILDQEFEKKIKNSNHLIFINKILNKL